jgi:AcrR family transcriptional regulator
MISATASAADPPASVRTIFLDAAIRCLRDVGIRRTTMVRVADEAGLSRAWLYRHYPDKASLLGAALIRQDEQFWAGAHALVSREEGLAAQVAQAVCYSRRQEPDALVLRLRASEPEACAAILGAGLRQAVPGMAVFWHPYLETARDRGAVRANLDIARAAEWVIRVVISLVTTTGDAVDADDPVSVRRFVDEFLVPGLS